MKLFVVELMLAVGSEKETRVRQFYVAPNINALIKSLTLDLEDEATEVLSISALEGSVTVII